MSKSVNLGLVQFVPEKWNVADNWGKVKELLLAEDQGHQLDLAITPECVVDGYAVSGAPKDPAEPWPDRDQWIRECALDPRDGILREASELAHKLNTYLVLGYTRLLDGGRAANAAGVFSRKGELLANYHKTHLQNHDLQCEPGQQWVVVDADFGRFGVLICADRRWPEAVRCQRLMGAELLANPTYGMHGDMNTAMMRTRGFENGFFIAFTHPKQSLVIGPRGEVEVDIRSECPVVVRHTIDLERLEDSHLRDRRVDLYRNCLF